MDKLNTEGSVDRSIGAFRPAQPEGDPRAGRQPLVGDVLRRVGDLALRHLSRRELNEPPLRGGSTPGRAVTAEVVNLAEAAARRAGQRPRTVGGMSMHVPQPNPGTPPTPPPEIPPTPDVVPPDIQDPLPTPHQQPPIIDPMPEPGPPNPIRARR